MAESKIEPLCPVRFRSSDGELYAVDRRDIEEVFRRDPEGGTVAGDDPNELLLTAGDCAWLWERLPHNDKRNSAAKTVGFRSPGRDWPGVLFLCYSCWTAAR